MDVPLVETPILTSDLGAVVTILDWRPTALLGDKRGRAPDLTLNVTLPFKPSTVKSAESGVLVWTAGATSGNMHSGIVKVPTPTQGADYVIFHVKSLGNGGDTNYR